MATYAMPRLGAGQNVVHGIGSGGDEKIAVTQVDLSVTGALASGSVLTGPTIQAGCLVTGVKLIFSGTSTATLSVGDAALATRYINGTTTSPATSVAFPFLVTVNGPVLITTGTAATTASGLIALQVSFLPRNA